MKPETNRKNNAKGPRVSVILPHYNAPECLNRALSSVLQQTYQDFEVVVIDDCSDVHAALAAVELVDGLQDTRVRIIPLELNGGPGRARQIGITAASGDFLAFLDCDDAWVEWKLESQVAFMDRNPRCFALSCILADSSVHIGPAAGLRAREVRPYSWLTRNHFTTSATLLRNSNFDFDEGSSYSEDYASWIRNTSVIGGSWVSSVPVGWRWKRPFGDGGLSGQLVRMQLGQMRAISNSKVNVPMRPLALLLAYLWSIARFLVRLTRVLIWRLRLRVVSGSRVSGLVKRTIGGGD